MTPDPVSFRPLALGPLIIAVALGWLGLRSDNPWLELLACAALGPLVSSYLGRARLDGLTLHWSGPLRCTAGEVVEHRLALHNGGRRTSPALTLQHQLPGFADVLVAVPALAPGERAEVRLPRLALARTVAREQRGRLLTAAPFGLVERRRPIGGPVWVAVHPAPAEPARLDPRGGDGDRDAGRPARSGADVHAVREWRPGDEARRVHWRSTARRGQLVIVEPERATAGRLALLLVADPADAGWEPLLSRAAATAAAALRAGREVRVLARGGAAPDDLVPADPTALLDWFAALTAARPPGADQVRGLQSWAGPGGELVLAGPRFGDGISDPRLLAELLAGQFAGPLADQFAGLLAGQLTGPGAGGPGGCRLTTLGPPAASWFTPLWAGGTQTGVPLPGGPGSGGPQPGGRT